MKNRYLTAVLAAMLLCCGMTGCGTNAVTTQAENMTEHIYAQSTEVKSADLTFETAQTGFALNLLRETAKADPGRNLLLSPYSVMQVLAMTANGAAGNTRAELEQVLGGIPAEELSQYLCGQRTSLPAGAGNQFRTANSFWVRNDEKQIQLREDFVQKSVDYFGADIYRAPFDDSTKDDINKWCSNKTDGRIPEMLSDPIPPNALMYLVNAVSFDAEWEEKYEDAPKKQNFTAWDGKTQTALMMESAERLYLHDAHAQGFLKPYQGGSYALAAVLPEAGMTPEEYLGQVHADEFLSMLQNAKNANVFAGLPQFAFDYGLELKPVLQSMGAADAFEIERADFSELNALNNKICISRVLHKTHIEVDTNGTKAFGVTLEEEIGSYAPPEPDYTVILDRPFICMIVDMKTMTPVFTGIVNEIPQ